MRGPGRSTYERLGITMVKGMDFKARLPGFEFQPSHLLAGSLRMLLNLSRPVSSLVINQAVMGIYMT